MNVAELDDTFIKTGICCYGLRQYRQFFCTSTFSPGTGDYEESPKIINALDQKRDATEEELLKALNYYLDADTFIKL